SKKSHTRTFLYFGAANYLVRVWLNGKKLGEHVGGFTPFDFEITDQIMEGGNKLVVEVEHTRHAHGVPAMRADGSKYAGLTRSVKLVEVPKTFIEDYSVQLSKNAGQIDAWVKVNGSSSSEVTLEISELHIKQNVKADSNGRAEFHISAKPNLWSPENP